jgi:hypothetical protein
MSLKCAQRARNNELEMRATGHAAMNAFVAARVKKRRRDVREQNSRPVFSGSDMAERKRNSTGREVLPAKTLAGGLALRGTATEDSTPPHRILRRRAQGEATEPAARILG